MCKRKCTTGDKLHQTHSQECRPCVMYVLPPRCYYYLGTQPGVMVCQLFPAVCTGTRHRHPGTSEGLWGRERQSAVSMWLHVWSGRAGTRREWVCSSSKQGWHLMSRHRSTLLSDISSIPWQIVLALNNYKYLSRVIFNITLLVVNNLQYCRRNTCCCLQYIYGK